MESTSQPSEAEKKPEENTEMVSEGKLQT